MISCIFIEGNHRLVSVTVTKWLVYWYHTNCICQLRCQVPKQISVCLVMLLLIDGWRVNESKHRELWLIIYKSIKGSLYLCNDGFVSVFVSGEVDGVRLAFGVDPGHTSGHHHDLVLGTCMQTFTIGSTICET